MYVIQFHSNSGAIENCYFKNCEKYFDTTAAISYNPPSPEATDKLTIKGCTFIQSRSSGNTNFLLLKEGSHIDFRDNNINIWTNGKVFAKKITNPGDHTFGTNYMFPFDSTKIGTTNLPEGAIVDPEDKLDCQLPENVPIQPDHYYCGNIADPSESTVLSSQSFVQVYYSKFNENKNANGNGGAVFLSIPDQSTTDASNSIKFYHSIFISCNAQNGGAIYVESSDVGRLFDFNDCIFESNQQSTNGGGLYIKSAVSCFKFTKCVLSSNVANDGGAIYYISENENSEYNNYALQFIDCYFHGNKCSRNGCAIFISITSKASPRPIEINRCTFTENYAEDVPTEEDYERGAAIYYSLNCQSSDAPSGSSLEIDNCFRVYDCIFTGNYIYNCGGAMYISIANNEPYKPIEIVECLFQENHIDSADQSNTFGGAIYYVLSKTSESPNSDKPSLSINKCTFTNNYLIGNGGSVYILIKDAQSSRSIDIYDCIYEITEFDDTPSIQIGGFISYSIESSSNSLSDNNPPLHINNCSFSSTTNKFPSGHDKVERGGCLYFNIQNSLQKGTIEITDCKFSHVITEAGESYGGSIYYTSNTASSSDSSYKALSIKNCEFSGSNVKNLGGSIYIQFEKDESQKQIEISGCTFKQSTSENGKDAVYVKSDKKSNLVNFINCTFESCMVYLETLSSTLDDCHFNNIEADKHAIYYKKSPAEDFETSTISVNNCDFLQTSKVDSLVYFDTKLSSKFSFTENTINFPASELESHVLGCTDNFEIQDVKYWTFINNTLEPQEEVLIKTSAAEKIPAYCGIGFTCIPSPKNCDNNYRCELLAPDDQYPEQKVVLNDQVYDNLNTTLSTTNSIHGGTIRLTNYILECKNSKFTSCKAENGGGGGIYIVIKSADIKGTCNIEKCTFEECKAKFGGGIYIFSNQQTCDFTIIKCTFNNNIVETSGNDHLFGGSAIYLQTKNGIVLRCNFKTNAGSGVKIHHDDNIGEPGDSASSSLKLNSEDDEASIQIKDCFFETDKHSSSSLFYVREGKKQFSVNVVGNTFAGELPEGSYHIDGASDKKNDLLKMRIENNKFESERKLALNSKLNVLSFDVNNQQFLNKNESLRQNRKYFNSIVVAAVTVSAIMTISIAAFVIIRKRRNSQEESSTDDNENNSTEL